MSDTENLVEELKELRLSLGLYNKTKVADWKIVDKAIDKIEELSALYEKALHDLVIESKKNMDDGWVPVVYREPTKEEKEQGWCYVLECPIPEEGEEILVCYPSGIVDKDVCCYDDGYYLDGGNDFRDIRAWRELPAPYKGE